MATKVPGFNYSAYAREAWNGDHGSGTPVLVWVKDPVYRETREVGEYYLTRMVLVQHDSANTSPSSNGYERWGNLLWIIRSDEARKDRWQEANTILCKWGKVNSWHDRSPSWLMEHAFSVIAPGIVLDTDDIKTRHIKAAEVQGITPDEEEGLFRHYFLQWEHFMKPITWWYELFGAARVSKAVKPGDTFSVENLCSVDTDGRGSDEECPIDRYNATYHTFVGDGVWARWQLAFSEYEAIRAQVTSPVRCVVTGNALVEHGSLSSEQAGIVRCIAEEKREYWSQTRYP